jgi:hypothetical protein
VVVLLRLAGASDGGSSSSSGEGRLIRSSSNSGGAGGSSSPGAMCESEVGVLIAVAARSQAAADAAVQGIQAELLAACL